MSASTLEAPVKRRQNSAGDCPFPGLRPFEERESRFFRGREDDIYALLTLLRTQRFLAVLGSSGCGKSSLVRAGLIASLRAGDLIEGDGRWVIALLRPGGNPIAQLALSLYDAWMKDETFASRRAETPRSLAEFQVALHHSSTGLIDAARLLKLGQEDKLFILVDQFEEVFRFSGSSSLDDSRAFARLLATSFEQRDLPIYIALTMRSDFLGDCGTLPGLPEMINRGLYLVPQLERDQLRNVITIPIRRAGAEITERLVQRILNDATGDPDLLPILQHALMRLWRSAKKPFEKCFDIEDYEKIGALGGALGKHLQVTYEHLSPGLQPVAARLFRQITATQTDGRTVRNPQAFGLLLKTTRSSEEELVPVIDAFREEGRSFLMPPPPRDSDGKPLPPPTADLLPETILDISHEALIRQWDLLRRWADDEARQKETYVRLTRAARRWETGSRSERLLYKGDDLKEAEALWISEGHLLTGSEEEFLKAAKIYREMEQVKFISQAAETSAASDGKVFLCSSAEDEDFAGRLRQSLSESGYPAAHSRAELTAIYEKGAKLVDTQILAADAFLYLVTPAAVKSPYCQRELKVALDAGKRVIPIIYRWVPKDLLPEGIQSLQWVHLEEGGRIADSLQLLTAALGTPNSWVTQHTRLLVRATEWDRARRPGTSLLRGQELEDAREWLESAESGGAFRPTKVQTEYILNSTTQAGRQKLRLYFILSLIVGCIAAVISVTQSDRKAREYLALESRQKQRESEQALQLRFQKEQSQAQQEFQRRETQREKTAKEALAVQLENLKSAFGAPGRQTSANGRYILTVLDSQNDQNGDQDLMVLDKVSNELHNLKRTPGNKLICATFNPDSTQVAIGDLAGNVELYRLDPFDPSKPEARLSVGHSRIQSIAFDSEGKRLAVASQNGTVSVWDFPGLKGPPIVLTQQAPVASVQFGDSEDKDTVVTSADDGRRWIWSLSIPGKPLKTISAPTVALPVASVDPTPRVTVDPSPARAKIKVEYFEKKEDEGRISSVLEKLRFSAVRRISSASGIKTSVVAYGSAVPMQEVRALAIGLLQNGVPLTEVRPLRGMRAKESLIQLSGSYAASIKKPLTEAQIEQVIATGGDTAKTPPTKISISIVDGSQSAIAELLRDTLVDQGYDVPDIKLIGSLYVPDTTEVRYFQYPGKTPEAEDIRNTARTVGLRDARASFVDLQGKESNGGFEIWFSRDAAPTVTPAALATQRTLNVLPSTGKDWSLLILKEYSRASDALEAAGKLQEKGGEPARVYKLGASAFRILYGEFASEQEATAERELLNRIPGLYNMLGWSGSDLRAKPELIRLSVKFPGYTLNKAGYFEKR